jgi:hypothetical protein
MSLRVPIIVIALILAFAIGYIVISSDDADNDAAQSSISADASQASSSDAPDNLVRQFPDADLSQTLVDYSKVFSGGPARDGIPALTNPSFDSLSTVDTPGDTLGILIEHSGEKRFYPYNILVWHEIVNDSIGDLDFTATFCPLCGSAIVFDRNIDGEVKEFGVSGFLFESNMIMFDRTDTPSLWSQARAEAIIGDELGTQLEIIDFQLLTFDDVRTLHPDAKVLSEDTGFPRNYSSNPYVVYEDTEDTFFDITVNDSRHPAKEVFYIVPRSDGSSTAIQIQSVNRGESFNNQDLQISIEKTSDGEVIARDDAGEVKPGYYEMWFSWAQHHQDDGEVWSF